METTQVENNRTDLSVPIEERFTLEARLAFSLSGQVFKAIDRASSGSVALWISRQPLSPDAIDRFLRRAGEICSLAGQPEAIAFGLDLMQRGWVSFRIFSGRHILEGRVDGREAERRWLGCARAIERMHRAGLACGDVCLESFLLSSDGEVRFLGGLGVLGSGVELFKAAPLAEAQELQMYLGPEQANSAECSMSTDVFALARLAARLISGKPLAQSAKDCSAGVSTPVFEVERAPAWFNSVILPLFSCPPEERYHTATDLMQALLRERTELIASSATQSKHRANGVAQEGTLVAFPMPTGRRKKGAGIAVGAAVLVGVVVGLSLFNTGGLAKLPPSVFSGTGISRQQVQALGASDDPMAHESLLRMAAAARDAGERKEVLEATLARARRLGLIRSSDLVREWIMKRGADAVTGGDAPPALKVLNPAIADSARMDILQQAYQADKDAVAQLAAALGLDLQNIEIFRPIYAQAAQELGSSPEPLEQSTAVIMVAVAPIRARYFSDLLESFEMTPADTVWLLSRLREQGEANVKPVAALGLKNGAFTGPRRVFAETLAGPTVLSTRDRIVLIACLISAPSKANAVALGASYNPDTPRALLALIWLSDDPEVRLAALDGLFAKPLGEPNLQRIAEFVKSKKPQERDRYSKLLATAGLRELLTAQEFSAGFTMLQQAPPEPDLIAALLQRAPAPVVFEVLAAAGDGLQGSVYLDLLKHPSKDVRIEALKRLRGFNDATMFALLRQMYDDERDEEVRQEYRAFLSS